MDQQATLTRSFSPRLRIVFPKITTLSSKNVKTQDKTIFTEKKKKNRYEGRRNARLGAHHGLVILGQGRIAIPGLLVVVQVGVILTHLQLVRGLGSGDISVDVPVLESLTRKKYHVRITGG
jgi:hypothetical protein